MGCALAARSKVARTFDGRMRNRLGFGFSQLDGFGFINAEQAVSAPLP